MRKHLALVSMTPLFAAACAVVVIDPEQNAQSSGGPGGGDAGTSSSASTGNGGSGAGCTSERVIWARRFGGGDDQDAYAVEPDGQGGVFVAGQYAGELDLGGGPLFLAGGHDMFLARFHGDGQHVWSKRFGDDGDQAGQTRLTLAPDGGVVFSGNFQGTVDFGDGPRTAVRGEAFVARYTADGAPVWSWTSTGTGEETVRKAAIAGDVVVIAGQFTSPGELGGDTLTSSGDHDAFMGRLDSGGAHVWDRRFGGAFDDSAEWIAVDPKQRVVLGGRAKSDVDLGTGVHQNAGDYDAFVAVYDLDATALWSTTFGDAGQQQVERIAISQSGDIVLGGRVVGSVDFGGGPLSSDGAFLVRLDEDGSHVASSAFEHVQSRFGLAVDAAGATLLAGSYVQTVDFGGGATASIGERDGVIAKLGPSFAQLWTLTFGSAEDDKAISVALDDAANVFVVGDFQGSIEVDGCPPLESAGGKDLLLMKLAP